MAQENLQPHEELSSYLDKPGRLKPEHQWRAVVDYRCKKSHLLGSVVKLRASYALYTLRRERQWQSEAADMIFLLAEPLAANTDSSLGIGGCRCQPVRTRELGQVWDDINRQRGTGATLRVIV